MSLHERETRGVCERESFVSVLVNNTPGPLFLVLRDAQHSGGCGFHLAQKSGRVMPTKPCQEESMSFRDDQIAREGGLALTSYPLRSLSRLAVVGIMRAGHRQIAGGIDENTMRQGRRNGYRHSTFGASASAR